MPLTKTADATAGGHGQNRKRLTGCGRRRLHRLQVNGRPSRCAGLVVRSKSNRSARASASGFTRSVNAAEPGGEVEVGAGVTRGGVRLSIIPKEPRYQQTRPRTSLNNRVTHPRP